MTDRSDDIEENGSPRHQEDESSVQRETFSTDAAPSIPQPMAVPAAPLSLPSTPPMQPGEVVPGSVASAWPTVLGILAIVFGGFGVLGGAWGVVLPFVADRLADIAPQMQPHVTLQREAWTGWRMVISISSILAASLLLFGGISLVRRRHRAASLLFIWSVVKVVLILAGVGLQFAIQPQAIDQAAAQLPNLPGGRGLLYGGVAVGIACGLIFQLAGPVFLLVWFRRGVIKEEVATWN